MLRDIIEFIQSRAGIQERSAALREINFAWREIWNIDDVPNSVQEITVSTADATPRLSLPYYVGRMRGVKSNQSRVRVHLYTPRSEYQESQYIQSPYTWVELGTSPLNQTLTNATTLTLRLVEPEAEQITATLLGPTENAAEDREQLVFPPGTTEMESHKRFTDLSTAVKNKFTLSDMSIYNANEVVVGTIPNMGFEAKNLLIQVVDKCDVTRCTAGCDCFDVLYKRVPPILNFDEQTIPGGYDEVLMVKTMEWILLPKEGQDQKAILFAEKGKAMMALNNEDADTGKRRRLDLGTNTFATRYNGYL